MTPNRQDTSHDPRCPLPGCNFLDGNGWERWRGEIDVKVEQLSSDISTLKHIGLAVVGALLLQMLATVWSAVTRHPDVIRSAAPVSRDGGVR